MPIENTLPNLQPWMLQESERLSCAQELAVLVRRETVRLAGIAKSGHFTSVFSCAEIFAALYSGILRISADPTWKDRDRFLLSKGHAAPGLYPLLSAMGYFPAKWLDTYAHLGSHLGDHPDMRKVPGIDFSSGSLGHNLSVGLGMAMGLRLQASDARVVVLLGDQELNEGQQWEAVQGASHFRTSNLVAVVDRNGMGLDGDTEEVMAVEPIDERFQAFGWRTIRIDGHDLDALFSAFDRLDREPTGQPTCIIADTIKGKGVQFMERDKSWHVGYLAPADEAKVLNEIGF